VRRVGGKEASVSNASSELFIRESVDTVTIALKELITMFLHLLKRGGLALILEPIHHIVQIVDALDVVSGEGTVKRERVCVCVRRGTSRSKKT
jgi:hypothetical protein